MIKDLQKSQNEKDELTKETLKQFGALISKNSGPPEMPKVTTGDTEPKPLSVEKLTEGQELSDETVPKFMQGEPLDQVSLGKMSAKSTGESKGEEPAKTGMKKLTDDEVIMPGDEAEQQVTKSDTPKDIDVERIEKEIVSKSVDLRSKLNKVTMVVSDDGVHNLNRRGARPAVIITVIALLIAAAGIFASNHTEKIKKIFALVMSDESKKNQAKLNPDKVKTGVNKDQKTRRIALRGEKQLSSDRELVTGNISNRKFTGEETSKKGVGSNTRESANLQNSDDGSVHISDKFHKNPELLLPTIQGQLAMPPALIGPYSLRHAAAKGDARAQYEVAKRFANGVGVKRNYDEAVKWYMYAAAQSLAPAQYRLATFYERGRGVKKNLQRAKIWYKRAAELGNVKAMHNLAVISAAQNKNKPDYLNAIHWFKEAARRNLADSQFNLAILYHNGVGLEKNLVEAYKWFSLAARQGDRDAGKRRDLIEKKLNKNQLRQALTMLQGWKPIAVKTEANTVGLKGRHITSVMSHAKETISRSRVLTAQILLRKLGYKLNDIDGVLTEDTINSIKKFQKDKGLPPTGKITNDLVKLLNKSAI